MYRKTPHSTRQSAFSFKGSGYRVRLSDVANFASRVTNSAGSSVVFRSKLNAASHKAFCDRQGFSATVTPMSREEFRKWLQKVLHNEISNTEVHGYDYKHFDDLTQAKEYTEDSGGVLFTQVGKTVDDMVFVKGDHSNFKEVGGYLVITASDGKV